MEKFEDNKDLQYQLADEMKKIQDEIEAAKSRNRRIKLKTFGRRTFQILKGGIALVFAPVLSSGIILAFGWNPYKLNESKKDTCIVSYIDSNGVKNSYETNFEYNGNKQLDCITYYDKWIKLDDGNYARNVYSYKAKEDSMLTLMGMLNDVDKIDLKAIEQFVVESLVTNIEIKSNLTKEELENGAYVTCTYYDANNERQVIIRETESEHKHSLVGFVGINILLMIIEFVFLATCTNFLINIRYAFTDKIYLTDIEKLKQNLDEVTKQMLDTIGNKPKNKKLSNR